MSVPHHVFGRWDMPVLSNQRAALPANRSILRTWRLIAASAGRCDSRRIDKSVVYGARHAWLGLIIPHFTRMITGPDNRKVIPATIFIGAAYLIVVDDISRLAFSYEIPIGIVTALVGIPCFAVVLRNARKGWS